MTNRSIFIALLLCAAFNAACSRESVVSNAPPQSASSAAPSSPTPAQAEPTPSAPVTAATPNSVTAAATPSPTPLPIIKQAQTHPGVPVAAPDVVKRPLTGAELEKALQQLPPEVRARIQGLAAKPPASPQPTKKP